MNQLRLTKLFDDLLGDLQDPDQKWQVGAIVASILVGWGLSRLLRARVGSRTTETGVLGFGMESFGRVVGPLAIVCLLVLSQVVLERWHHVNLVKLALPIFGSLAVIRFVFYLLRRVFIRQGEIGEAVLTFEKIFQLVVWLAFALYITGYWDDIHRYLDSLVLHMGKNKVTVAEILQAIVSVVVMLVLAMWAGAALEERLMHVETLHSNLRVVLARTGRALLIVVAVLLSLNIVGIDLTVLSVFGGALGVGLGLGLQKIASSYISGFVILLERSLAIGDMVNVDRYFGKVTQINTRYTILEGLDGIESVLPNEMFMSSPVHNYSLNRKIIRLATQVTILYQDDIETVLSMLEQATMSVERVSDQILPQALLIKIGEDGLQ